MAQLVDIREGLRAALATVFEPAVTVTGYMKKQPQSISMQVMGVESVEYDQAMRGGLATWTILIQAFSGSPGERAAQTRLDTWIDHKSSTSVKAAVEADITLGGKVTSARVARCSGYREYDLSGRGNRTLGAEFTVVIHTQ